MKQTFEQWFHAVDILIREEIGIGANDLPDCCYHDWYDQGVRPKSAAKRAIKGLYS